MQQMSPCKFSGFLLLVPLDYPGGKGIVILMSSEMGTRELVNQCNEEMNPAQFNFVFFAVRIRKPPDDASAANQSAIDLSSIPSSEVVVDNQWTRNSSHGSECSTHRCTGMGF